MKHSKKNIHTDSWPRKIKNTPFAVVVIISFMAIGGIVNFTESASKLNPLLFTALSYGSEISASLMHTVEIMGLPVSTNSSAELRPHGLMLEVYGGRSVQKMRLLGYPIRKQFVWSPKTGDKVVLRILIGELVLEKTYPGKLGFAEFLTEFSKGERIFRPNEFGETFLTPLEKLGVEYIGVSFGIKGAEPVIEYLSK